MVHETLGGMWTGRSQALKHPEKWLPFSSLYCPSKRGPLSFGVSDALPFNTPACFSLGERRPQDENPGEQLHLVNIYVLCLLLILLLASLCVHGTGEMGFQVW